MSKKKKLQGQKLLDEAKRQESLSDELANVELGENHQERMVDHSERHNSLRHQCKGRHCDTAFEKL